MAIGTGTKLRVDKTPKPRIAIIGGGYSGAASAILLSRLASQPLDIKIIEPRPAAGRGIAFDTHERAFRLNVPPALMVLYFDDVEHFSRHVTASNIASKDPDAIAADGAIYPRRSVFGDYMAAELKKHMVDNPSRSSISHIVDRAMSVDSMDDGYVLGLEGGDKTDAEALLFCSSYGQPEWPASVAPELTSHPAMVSDPWSPDFLDRVGKNDRVLFLGAGLTAGDIIAALHLRGHTGDCVMLSRHGLPANRQHDFGDINRLLERVRRPVPDLIERHGNFTNVAKVLRAVRSDIADVLKEDKNADWRDPFDHVRDAFGAIWRNLPDVEKQRYVRHLASYYGAHRNRVAPQVVDCLQDLKQAGKLTQLAGRIYKASAAGTTIDVVYRERRDVGMRQANFDWLINCTGPVLRPDAGGNPLFQDAISKGLVRADPFGLGLSVNGDGKTLGGQDEKDHLLFVGGPLGRGFFGDVVGVPQITAQLHTVLPALLRDLGDN